MGKEQKSLEREALEHKNVAVDQGSANLVAACFHLPQGLRMAFTDEYLQPI